MKEMAGKRMVGKRMVCGELWHMAHIIYYSIITLLQFNSMWTVTLSNIYVDGRPMWRPVLCW